MIYVRFGYILFSIPSDHIELSSRERHIPRQKYLLARLLQDYFICTEIRCQSVFNYSLTPKLADPEPKGGFGNPNDQIPRPKHYPNANNQQGELHH